jgi:ribosomal protein S17E
MRLHKDFDQNVRKVESVVALQTKIVVVYVDYV